MNTLFRDWIDRIYPSIDGAPPKGLGGFKVNAADAKTIIIELTQGLPRFVPDSTGLRRAKDSVRPKSFQLNTERGKVDPTYREAKAEREIFKHYRKTPKLCENGNLVNLKSIHSFQVPLYALAASDLGEIDLLGTTSEGLPAVIELKCLGDISPRSVGGLLGPIIQGLAYALTIRHYWAAPSCEFRKEWLELQPSCDLPKSLEGQTTPIIVAGHSNFWSAPSTWSKCPWSLFVKLANALNEAKLPLFAARFESLEKLELEFAPFADLKGCEVGTDPLWPTRSLEESN